MLLSVLSIKISVSADFLCYGNQKTSMKKVLKEIFKESLLTEKVFYSSTTFKEGKHIKTSLLIGKYYEN